MQLILVRHGSAGHKLQSPAADRRRGLTRRGLHQADRLVEVLVPLKPTRILSSPLKRCLETVAPLVEATAIEVETNSALTPSRPTTALRLIRGLTAPNSRSGVVVCTHGEVMGFVLARMAEDDGVKLERRPPGLKGCVWVLEARRGKLVGTRYIAP